METELVNRAGLPLVSVHAGAIHGVGPARLLFNAVRMARGLWESLGLMRRARPDALMVTGGFVALPVALAAWLSRVPVLLYVPDIEPGWALKVLGRLANTVALTADASRRFFPARPRRRVVVSGYPTRPELAPTDRASARASFDLDSWARTLLVFGGSRGARSINRALLDALPELLAECQVIHISGELDWPAVKAASESLPDGQRARYRAFAYLHEEMALALSAADLVISRAGASVLGEFPLFGLPSIVVPYPHAWRYQKVNADHLVERGAATMLKDEGLGSELLTTALELIRDPERLARMGAASKALASPGSALRIADEFRRLARRTEIGEGASPC